METKALGLLSTKELKRIHQATLRLLENTGLKIMCADFYGPLESKGAKIDKSSNVVKFPRELVESTIESLRGQIESGARQNILNGVIASKTSNKIQAKFGGACIEYLDWEKKEVRAPTEQDLIDMLQLGQVLEDVAIVGNPVCYLRDKNGNKIEPRLQRIMTAAMVAKNTDKCASTEVWNGTELELLVEMGLVVHGSMEAYRKKPCFITAKETIAPLLFPEEDGKVLLMLAERSLPVTIIPMPLQGASTPVTIASNVVIGNAEILGVMAAIRAVHPEAVVGAGVISGIIDMASGSSSYSAPEAQKQDLIYAQLYEELYGQDLGIGGYIDAKLPGAQATGEIANKVWSMYHTGRCNYPVGLLAGGIRFSGEQALIGLEVARMIHRQHEPVEVDDDTLQAALIEKVGIGGNFMAEEHTAFNFRRTLWMPQLMDRSLPQGIDADMTRDMVNEASRKIKSILTENEPYRLSPEQEKAIDDIIEHAKKIL